MSKSKSNDYFEGYDKAIADVCAWLQCEVAGGDVDADDLALRISTGEARGASDESEVGGG